MIAKIKIGVVFLLEDMRSIFYLSSCTPTKITKMVCFYMFQGSIVNTGQVAVWHALLSWNEFNLLKSAVSHFNFTKNVSLWSSKPSYFLCIRVRNLPWVYFWMRKTHAWVYGPYFEFSVDLPCKHHYENMWGWSHCPKWICVKGSAIEWPEAV